VFNIFRVVRLNSPYQETPKNAIKSKINEEELALGFGLHPSAEHPSSKAAPQCCGSPAHPSPSSKSYGRCGWLVARMRTRRLATRPQPLSAAQPARSVAGWVSGCYLVRSNRPARPPPVYVARRPRNQGTPPSDMHPIAPQRRPFRPHFTCLYRLVLTRSRCPQLPKANNFLTHLALLVGPETLSRPATAQKPLGRGRPPPCAPPWAAARRPPKRGGSNGHSSEYTHPLVCCLCASWVPCSSGRHSIGSS
jgi:hypothetical protein